MKNPAKQVEVVGKDQGVRQLQCLPGHCLIRNMTWSRVNDDSEPKYTTRSLADANIIIRTASDLFLDGKEDLFTLNLSLERFVTATDILSTQALSLSLSFLSLSHSLSLSIHKHYFFCVCLLRPADMHSEKHWHTLLHRAAKLLEQV